MALRSEHDAVPVRNILSLCAGVGGLELGISLALHHLGEAGRGVCYVEREAAAAASLVASMEAGWFHPAPVWSDMLTFDARAWRGLVHILASGDPCQDNSVAGKRAGADGERFLAPEVCRLAAECRPDLVFRENVPGNADGQLAALVPALEGLGYRVAAGIFSASETGNTMRRERLFIMAEREPAKPTLPEYDGPWPSPRRLDGAESGTRSLYARSGQPGEREADAGRAGAGVDGFGGGRHGHAGGAIRTGRYGSFDAGVPVARPGSEGSQGQQRGSGDAAGRQEPGRPAGLRGGAILPPAVIPGPTDSRWSDLLDRFPEYQPALSQKEAESHLRRGVDAMARRVERLRATGNGVDPMVAAHAFLSLRALLSGQRTGAGEFVLMEAAA